LIVVRIAALLLSGLAGWEEGIFFTTIEPDTLNLSIHILILTTMKSLFKQERPKNAQRVCRVENLNPEKGVTLSYKVSEDQRDHTVVLCLADKTVKTVFHSEFSALDKMGKYRQLYKAK
jgi:hypothetical protein